MTDLGQTTAMPNILLNATVLQYFTQNFTYMQNYTVNAQPGLANDSYEALNDQTGPLNTYKDLDAVARKSVWSNFVDGNQRSNDISDEQLGALAEEPLNGRQIKIAVKTAKLLARTDDLLSSEEHIRTVLRVMEENREDMD
ncbi:hypothetical protein OEA41_001283 [Lepraria neglecta]|uniref:Uncharacterized protein n=1 Tax=Lepraria neglecta TaxID=209136 RepID=A0AAD9Z9S1_9LECA|nr:hypothetical protein OEA41_001283 [Lepraria neglecta]